MSAAKTILLPRGYLSWTQQDLWERNKQEYQRIYFMGGTVPRNRYTDFGSEVAEDAEKGTSSNEEVRALNAMLPAYDSMEHKIDARVKTERGFLLLHGRLDTYDTKAIRFRERKTGKVAWTDRRVARHGQIDFYHMLIFLSTNKPPTEAWLDWAQTQEDDDGVISLTGHCEEFRADRSMEDILRMISRAKKAAFEIEDAYTKLLGL